MAKTIELAAQSVKAGEKVAYKVLDENGLDITATTTVVVETDKEGFFLPSLGQVIVKNPATAQEAFAKFSVKDASGKVIATSERVKVKVAEAAPTTIGDFWTLSTTANTAGNTSTAVIDKDVYKATTYKQDSTVNLASSKEYVKVSVLDQFGKDFTSLNGYTLQYKSLDTDVAIVDASTGEIKPLKAGNVVVEVTLVKNSDASKVATKQIELTVAEKAEFETFELEATEVALTTVDNTKTVKVKGLDQFGDKFDLADAEVTVTSSATDVASVAKVYDDNGKVSGIKVDALTKAGTATITVKVGEVSQTITVNVTKPGEAADYVVEGFKNELFFVDKVENDQIDDTQFELKVKSVDENGLAVGYVTDYATEKTADKVFAQVSYKNEAGEAQTAVLQNGTVNFDAYEDAKGDITLTVFVGTLEVFKDTYKVTDNRVAPEFTVNGNDLEFTTTANTEAILAAIKGLLDFDIKDGATVAVTGSKFVSYDDTIIKLDTTGNDGTTQIALSEVTISYDEDGAGAKVAEPYTLKLSETINVKVTAAAYVAAKNGTATAKQYGSIIGKTVSAQQELVLDTYFATNGSLTNAEIKKVIEEVVGATAKTATADSAHDAPPTASEAGKEFYKFATALNTTTYKSLISIKDGVASVVTITNDSNDGIHIVQDGKTRVMYAQLANGTWEVYTITPANKPATPTP